MTLDLIRGKSGAQRVWLPQPTRQGDGREYTNELGNDERTNTCGRDSGEGV
jgi:hypothetical protein